MVKNPAPQSKRISARLPKRSDKQISEPARPSINPPARSTLLATDEPPYGIPQWRPSQFYRNNTEKTAFCRFPLVRLSDFFQAPAPTPSVSRCLPTRIVCCRVNQRCAIFGARGTARYDEVDSIHVIRGHRKHLAGITAIKGLN